MSASGFVTSRRTLLSGLAASSVTAWPSIGVAPEGALPFATSDEPVSLMRSREGRSLSRFRYHNAEGFFVGIEAGSHHPSRDQLYQVGIVIQLGLSAHLLDVGFDDAWCARHLGLHVAKSLAYANATGLGHECPKLERLAAILSPYGKWRHADLVHSTCDCPFSEREVRQLTRALLERVREVTGHARPRGLRKRLL
jgi:hypothetical protein